MLLSISTFYDEDIAICRVEFEGGHVGFGQLGNKDVDITLELLHRRVAPALLQSEITLQWNMNEMLGNRDTLFSPIMELVLRFELNYKMMGVQLSKAVAGVDSAIWDAVARARRCQVWQVWRNLFFPQNNKSRAVPVYASSIARSIAAGVLAEKFLELKRAHGIKAFKMKVGTRMAGVRFSTEHDEQITLAQRAVDEMHSLIGKDCKLAVDCNGAFASKYELPTKCWFLEEPYPWFHKPPSRGELGVVPLAGGEQEFRADVWLDLISTRALDIYQPDFGYSGGPSSVLLIALKCAAAGGLVCVPHSPQNDLHPIMALHMVKAMGTGYVELACVDDGLIQVKLDLVTGIFIPRFAKSHGFRILNGEIELTSNEHGWGVDFHDAWLQQRCKTQISTRTSTQASDTKRSHL